MELLRKGGLIGTRKGTRLLVVDERVVQWGTRSMRCMSEPIVTVRRVFFVVGLFVLIGRSGIDGRRAGGQVAHVVCTTVGERAAERGSGRCGAARTGTRC